MTTPGPDDGPRLAEIARTISDFRSEFREAISGMVRRDVYTAEMRVLEVRIENLAIEQRRIEKDAQAEIQSVYQEIEKDRTNRKGMQAQIFGAGIAALFSLVLLVIQVVIK